MSAQRAPRRTGPSDEGMTLIEVMVAFAVFAVFATAALTVLGASITVSRDDTSRLVATNLATRELEVVRDAFLSSSRGPTTVVTNAVTNPTPLNTGGAVGDPLVVDGVPYTVVRTAQWSAVDDSATSTCDDGSSAELGYLAVTVAVSWPDLRGRPPVRMYTTLTPPKGTYSGVDGHLGVSVRDRDGRPRAGVTVTATGPTRRSAVTGSDGCALLAFLAPGSYTVELDAPGSVDPAGSASASTSVTVSASQLARLRFDYDRAASLNVVFVTATGYPTPPINTIAVSLGNAALTPSGTRAVAGTSDLRTIDTLWPYAGGYRVWAGACEDNDPAFVPSGGTQGRVEPAAASTPGATTTVSVPLTPVRITGAQKNKAVTATQIPAESGCATMPSVSLGKSSSSGSLDASLPLGTWSITGGNKKGEVVLRPEPVNSASPFPATAPVAALS